MELEFLVQNVKCGGCANAIRTGLSTHPQVSRVEVDVPTGRVTVHTTGAIRPDLTARLQAMGYPERV